MNTSTHKEINGILKEGISKYLSAEQLDKIKRAKIFIAGCGGLGSNATYMLVKSGFINFTILDCDTIEPSNLNRQFFFPSQIGMKKTDALVDNLKLLEPDLNITIINKRLDLSDDIDSLTNDCDILVEAFDNPESKSIFVSGAVPTGKPVICVSGIAGYGNSDNIVTKKMGTNLYIIGDGESDIKNVPPLAPRVTIAAAKQADLVLSLVLG